MRTTLILAFITFVTHCMETEIELFISKKRNDPVLKSQYPVEQHSRLTTISTIIKDLFFQDRRGQSIDTLGMPQHLKWFAKKNNLQPPCTKPINEWIRQLEKQWEKQINSQNYADTATYELPSEIQKVVVQKILNENRSLLLHLAYFTLPKLIQPLRKNHPLITVTDSCEVVFYKNRIGLCVKSLDSDVSFGGPYYSMAFKIHDVETQKKIYSIKLPFNDCYKCFFDEEKIIFFQSFQILIWDINNRKLLHTIIPPEYSRFSICYFRENQLLLKLFHLQGADSFLYVNIASQYSINFRATISPDQTLFYKKKYIIFSQHSSYIGTNSDIIQIYDTQGQLVKSYNVNKNTAGTLCNCAIINHCLAVYGSNSIILWNLEIFELESFIDIPYEAKQCTLINALLFFVSAQTNKLFCYDSKNPTQPPLLLDENYKKEELILRNNFLIKQSENRVCIKDLTLVVPERISNIPLTVAHAALLQECEKVLNNTKLISLTDSQKNIHFDFLQKIGKLFGRQALYATKKFLAQNSLREYA